MSVPTTSPLPPDAPLPVFVDESGRRRARTRVVTRVLVAGAGIYVLIVIAGLTGSVSLPGVHLGQLERVAPGRAHPGRLGPDSKVLELPAALEPSRSPRESTPATGGTSPGGVGAAPNPRSSSPGRSGNAGLDPTQKSPATSRGTSPTATSSPTSTSNPLGSTTTTMKHGPPTSTPHGPPSTKPGVGRGRNKL